MTQDKYEPATLSSLGYDSFFSEQLEELPGHFAPARIVGQHRREWDVRDEKGIRRAVLAGRRWSPGKGARTDEAQPTIGDWVLLSENAGELPVIEHVLSRRTYLARTSPAKRGQRQVIVANVDMIAVVSAFSPPGTPAAVARRTLHPRRIERYLAAIRPGGAEPIVLINKADLQPDTSALVKELSTRLAGAKVLSISAKSETGLAPLKKLLSPGKTIGFVGLSGVGKSSIVNELLGHEAQRVHEARAEDARGRHTTTHRSLFVTKEGFLLIDTPGMRELAISETDDADLGAFADIDELARACRFRDCSHEKEPGCAVVSAANSGKIDPDRLVSYRALAQELSANHSPDAAARAHSRRPMTKKSRARRQQDDDWNE